MPFGKKPSTGKDETNRLHRSQPINMENIGSVHFRLEANDGRKTVHLVKADVEVAGATIFVTLQRETRWPYRIENLSQYPFELIQSVRKSSQLYTFFD
jgi:vacuolar protein sorting-associated protein 13A/C